jgi:hypothetical protein
MNTDIRLLLSFRHHPKTKKLKYMLGNDGVVSFIWLLMFAAESRPDGNLEGLDEIDIAMASDWEGDTSEFTEALAAIGFLEKSGDGFRINDWEQHNPWAANAQKRSAHARKAAKARWGIKYGNDDPETETQRVTEKRHALSIDEQCTEHEGAMRGASMSNAPTPTPTPAPTPTPTQEEHGSSIKPMNRTDYSDAFEETWKSYPRRNGSNPKKPAYSAYKQRLKEGIGHEEIQAGVQRYAAWCDATDKTGTETVMQAKRLFGPGREWDDDWLPPDKPLKLPRDNQTLWQIRADLGLPFEYEDLDECHREIRSRLRQKPEQRSLIEGMV